MPRDGSGVYTQPFPDVVTATPISSTVYNGFVNDVEQDLNAVRPIISGGTGANSASQALFNMGGEMAAYAVTNYDSHVWYPGSFRAAAGATGSPNGAHAFSGIVHINEPLAFPPTNQNVTVEARDLTDGKKYFRIKTAGVWGAWVADVTAADLALKVAKAGDTMTGVLNIAPGAGNGAILALNAPSSAESANIFGQVGGVTRWRELFADVGAGDYFLIPHNDAGVAQTAALVGTRSTGLMTVKADPTAALGIATKQYTDATGAASVREGFRQITGADTITVADIGRHIRFNSGADVSVAVDSAATVGVGFWFSYRNDGGGAIALTTSGGSAFVFTGGSATSFFVPPGDHGEVWCANSTTFFVERQDEALVSVFAPNGASNNAEFFLPTGWNRYKIVCTDVCSTFDDDNIRGFAAYDGVPSYVTDINHHYVARYMYSNGASVSGSNSKTANNFLLGFAASNSTSAGWQMEIMLLNPKGSTYKRVLSNHQPYRASGVDGLGDIRIASMYPTGSAMTHFLVQTQSGLWRGQGTFKLFGLR